MSIKNSVNYYYGAINNLILDISNNPNELIIKINTLSNDIKSDLNILNINKRDINNKIDILSRDNNRLREIIKSEKDSLNTSKILFEDSKNNYSTKLIENYLLFLSIFGIIYGIYIFKDKNTIN